MTVYLCYLYCLPELPGLNSGSTSVQKYIGGIDEKDFSFTIFPITQLTVSKHQRKLKQRESTTELQFMFQLLTEKTLLPLHPVSQASIKTT